MKANRMGSGSWYEMNHENTMRKNLRQTDVTIKLRLHNGALDDQLKCYG